MFSNVLKLFTAAIYEFLYLDRVFVPGKTLQTCLVFVAGHLSDALLLDRLLASLPNIRLDWQGLPRINTLAYNKNS